MRYISMHKSNASMEAGEPPSAELMAGMGPLMGEMIAAGVFLAGEGLQPSSKGVRLKFSGGKRTITQGPFVGSNELIDSYLIVRVTSIDEAIDWATRFAGVADAGDRCPTRHRTVGHRQGPANLPDKRLRRFLILPKSDSRTEGDMRPLNTHPSAIPPDVLLRRDETAPRLRKDPRPVPRWKRTVIVGPVHGVERNGSPVSPILEVQLARRSTGLEPSRFGRVDSASWRMGDLRPPRTHREHAPFGYAEPPWCIE
jgi:hypothetical protein